MDIRTVVWVAPTSEPPDEARHQELLARGYFVVRCGPGEGRNIGGAEFRVLESKAFASLAELVAEYERDLRPTVLLVDSHREEATALEFLRDHDDLAHVAATADVLARRLLRLAARYRELQRIQELTTRDPLTGLLNRRSFEASFPLWTRQHEGVCKALVFLDVDDLKLVNDSHGHQAGDSSLREIAERLSAATEPADLVARLGGDEFGVLLARGDEHQCIEDAERMRISGQAAEIALPRGRGAPTTVSLSAGLMFVGAGDALQEAIERVDMALYRAKATGKDRLVTFPSLRANPADDDKDLRARFFHDVTKVTTARVARLLTLFSGDLFNKAHREANLDDKTQLNNSRYFNDRIRREIELARRDGRKLSLAMLDLDDFARFNKEYGELTGDAVLRTFADVASVSIRNVDWMARYGGDEFRLVVPGELSDAMNVAERIRANVEAAEIMTHDKQPVRLTVSIGVAELTSDVGDARALQEKANVALREAKKRKNCVVAKQ